MQKEFAKHSIFTQQLYNRLKELKPGERVSYKELEDIIGMPVQAHLSQKGYGYLATARNLCERNDEMVIEPIGGKFLECLEDKKKGELGYRFIASVRRKTQKGINKMLTVSDFGTLSNKEKIQHNTAMSILGIFGIITKPDKIASIENKVEIKHQQLNFNETIKLFE